MPLTRLRGPVVLAVVFITGLAAVAIADAQSTPVSRPVPSAMKIGVLKLTSSAPIFVGVEKGFFKEFGVEPELVYFQAAAPIATALAAGLRSIKDLKGKRIGVTQLGSTFHYHIGNILEKDGLRLTDVKIVPLQAMAATVEALKGKQVDAILVPQPFPGAAEAQGFGKIMAWAGDLYPWQIATIFYSGKFATDRARAVAFMKGYVKASRHYHDAALVQKDGRLVPGAGYEDVVQITAKYTGARPENIKLGFPFQDRNGRLLVTDIERQMAWWTANGFMKKTLPLRSIVDTSFVEEAVKALDR